MLMMDTWSPKDDFWFEVTFVYRTEANHNSVYLTGDFNGWSREQEPMQRCAEGYSTALILSEGFYHYKFLVDGCWQHDSHNAHRGGEHGNSIMFVHMDPNVYGLRSQCPPLRDYHRSMCDKHFQTLLPSLPADLVALGILQRLVFVYLPPSYFTQDSRCYPVVYANDGQNLFSTPEHKGGPFRGGWALDARLDQHWANGRLQEFILVAVPNSDFVCIGNRTREYCTADFLNTSQDPYIRYLIEVVKKEIDVRFRTLPEPANAITLGASCGGLCAFVTAVTHPHVFGGAVCLSPAFWHVDRLNKSAYSLVQSRPQPSTRLFIDSGDGLGDNRYVVRMMSETLSRYGWEHGYLLDECATRVEHNITHCECVWGERVDQGLAYVLQTNNDHG